MVTIGSFSSEDFISSILIVIPNGTLICQRYAMLTFAFCTMNFAAGIFGEKFVEQFNTSNIAVECCWGRWCQSGRWWQYIAHCISKGGGWCTVRSGKNFYPVWIGLWWYRLPPVPLRSPQAWLGSRGGHSSCRCCPSSTKKVRLESDAP